MSQPFLIEPTVDLDCLEQQALAVLDRAVDEYGPVAVVGAISGGNDSLCAGRIASKHPATTSYLHIDTQTAPAEVEVFTRRVVESWGFDLRVQASQVWFLDLCRTYGMLGAGRHRVYFNALKGRVFVAVAQELAPSTSERIVYVSGARKAESAKRKKSVIPVRKDRWEPRTVWAAPLWNWSSLECLLYMEREGLESNPVAQLLGRSGECNCPAYASEDELVVLQECFPDAAAKIEAGCAAAREGGTWDKWGVPVPKWFKLPEVGGLDQYLQPTVEEEACRDCPKRGLAKVDDRRGA